MRESSDAMTQALGAKRKSDVVADRVEVVLTIGPRDDLVVLAIFADFLEAAMQVADVRDAADDCFAIELEDQAEDAMRGRVLRADVDEHVLAFELRLHGRRRGNGDVRVSANEERDALRLAVRSEAGGREFNFDGALAHSPVFSPLLRRLRMSSGSSSYASAMESSSIE